MALEQLRTLTEPEAAGPVLAPATSAAAPRDLTAEHGDRIDGHQAPVERPRLEVQVRTGGPRVARVADRAEPLTPPDQLAGREARRPAIEVGVVAEQAALADGPDDLAAEPVRADAHDQAALGRADRATAGREDVDALVAATPAAPGRAEGAVELRRSDARDRDQERAAEVVRRAAIRAPRRHRSPLSTASARPA